MRLPLGFTICHKLAASVQGFMDYAKVGGWLFFGTEDRTFIAVIAPIIIFFSAVLSAAYHIGLMNYIVDHLSAIMEYCLGTTGPETMCCTANIFVGLLESPLLIKPYLPQFTESELVAVMVSGFASLAGSVMGAYIEMNISAIDLLTTSMMSAPGSMAVAKIIHPETEVSQFKSGKSTITQSQHANMFHALLYGANDALKLCVNIVSMISAFLIMIDLMDSLFGHATGTQ